MPPTRLPGAAFLAVALSLAAPAGAVTPNGRLQIIQLDVGQGDGAAIISPLGQVVMIDDGTTGTGVMGVTVLNQLRALGIDHVDYHFASHYHSDHVANIDEIVNGGIPIDYGWDRGGSYSSSYYTTYANTLGSKRRTMIKNQVITLDSLSAHPVRIKCVDLAGAGVSTTDENTLSMVLKISYGEFDAVYGGDLGGANSGSYKDIESIVGPEVGPVEVAKVHHHGSATSTNANWLAATQPKVALISAGTGNSYGHPTSAALTRLHNANVQTYWTETGSGVAPNPTWDHVSNGQIVISATWQPAGVDTVRGNGFSNTFTNSGTAGDVTAPGVAVTSPDGGEDWKAGSTHAITWSASDDVGVTAVDLAYSTNGGASFPNSIASGLANSGSYSWTVPNAPGTALRVRVRARDAAGNLGADSSAASFTISTWTITAWAGAGGSISPSGSVAVVQGASQGFTITPASGQHVAGVIVDGFPAGAVSSYTFDAVAANHAISASFALNTYTIVAGAGPGGNVTPSGDVVVSHGSNQSFAIRSATGFHVATLTVDGGAVTPDTTHTFSNVTAGHTIAATFSANAYALSVTTVGTGSVAKTPDQATYPYGTSVTLAAVPAAGWAFTGWSGDTTTTADLVMVTVDGAKSLTATFVDVAVPVVVVTAPRGGEAWLEGSVQSITWSTSDNVGVDSVDVDCSLTGPAGPWWVVAHGIANTGSCVWTLPAQASDSALVRVTAYDPARNAGSAASDSLFRIVNPNAVVGDGGPAALALARPQPNPGRGTTLLRFSLPGAGRARLEILDLAGRRVSSTAGDYAAGHHAWRWDGRGADGGPAGTGLYFVRLVTSWGTRTQQLVWLR